MKHLKTMCLTLFAAVLVSGFVLAEEVVSPATQTICPVMGGKINKEVYTDHKGNRIYFCCKSCIDVFNNNPDKFISKMAEEGVVLEKVPGDSPQKKNDGTGACGGCEGCS